ncbi:MAG: ABC transporter permease [Candidatus Izemoplasmatales bacterium]
MSNFNSKIKAYWKKIHKSDGFSALTGALLAIAIGLLVGMVLMIIINPENSMQGIGRLLKGMFNNPRGGWIGLGQMLYRATPIIFTGLAVAFAFKTGLFNIGATGQYTVGIFAALLVGVLGDKLGAFQWIVAVLAGMGAGFIWGAIPGIFKARYNVHEVITSIMFNYIGMYLVNGLLNSNSLKTLVVDGSTNRTVKIDQTARTSYGFFNDLFPNSGLDISILIAIGTAILMYFILNKTVFGRELKSVGLNRDAAKYAGVNEKRSIVLSMAISGMLAGLGGALFILAPSVYNLGTVYPIENVLLNPGFDGIPVALLASSNPIGVIFSTTFVSYIKLAGNSMQGVGFVAEIVEIIIAVIIYFSAFSLIMTQNIGNIKVFIKKFKKKKQKEKPEFKGIDPKAGEK